MMPKPKWSDFCFLFVFGASMASLCLVETYLDGSALKPDVILGVVIGVLVTVVYTGFRWFDWDRRNEAMVEVLRYHPHDIEVFLERWGVRVTAQTFVCDVSLFHRHSAKYLGAVLAKLLEYKLERSGRRPDYSYSGQSAYTDLVRMAQIAYDQALPKGFVTGLKNYSAYAEYELRRAVAAVDYYDLLTSWPTELQEMEEQFAGEREEAVQASLTPVATVRLWNWTWCKLCLFRPTTWAPTWTAPVAKEAKL
jgi:hypothetical protein